MVDTPTLISNSVELGVEATLQILNDPNKLFLVFPNSYGKVVEVIPVLTKPPDT